MQCGNCGAENQEGLRYCGNCGSPLAPPGVSYGVTSIPVPQKRSQGKVLLIIGGSVLGGVVLLCMGCLALLLLVSPSKSSPPESQATQSDAAASSGNPPGDTGAILPTIPPARQATTQRTAPSVTTQQHINEVTIKEIQTNYEKMTDLQRTQYAESLAGKRVHWSGKVKEVKSGGDITLDLGQKYSYYVTLRGVPTQRAVAINKDQTIEFDAKISRAYDSLGLNIELDLVALQ